MKGESDNISTEAGLAGEGNPASLVCLNCGVLLIGKFCYTCGQSAEIERYSISSFLRELYNSARKIDVSTMFTTTVELFLRPGEFVHEYLAGKRVGYTTPVKFYFYAMVADLLIRELLHRTTGDVAYASPLTDNTLFQLSGLLSTIFWGVLWKVFYRRTEWNTMEFAACAIYFEAQTNLIATFVLLISAPFRNIVPNLSAFLVFSDLLLTAVYGIYFAHRLFRENWLATTIKQTVLTLLFLIILVTVLPT